VQLNPSLAFNGTAEEALALYRKALGGEVQVMRFAETPVAEQVCDDFKNKVIYGTLISPLGTIAAMDCPPERGGQPGKNFSIAVHVDSASQADSVFTTLAAEGEITMPLDKTFFSERFGMLTDKFGVSWMINYAKN